MRVPASEINNSSVSAGSAPKAENPDMAVSPILSAVTTSSAKSLDVTTFGAGAYPM